MTQHSILKHIPCHWNKTSQYPLDVIGHPLARPKETHGLRKCLAGNQPQKCHLCSVGDADHLPDPTWTSLVATPNNPGSPATQTGIAGAAEIVFQRCEMIHPCCTTPSQRCTLLPQRPLKDQFTKGKCKTYLAPCCSSFHTRVPQLFPSFKNSS